MSYFEAEEEEVEEDDCGGVMEVIVVKNGVIGKTTEGFGASLPAKFPYR